MRIQQIILTGAILALTTFGDTGALKLWPRGSSGTPLPPKATDTALANESPVISDAVCSIIPSAPQVPPLALASS